jgi:hypothetical protein
MKVNCLETAKLHVVEAMPGIRFSQPNIDGFENTSLDDRYLETGAINSESEFQNTSTPSVFVSVTEDPSDQQEQQQPPAPVDSQQPPPSATETVTVEQIKAEPDKKEESIFEKGEKAVSWISGKVMAIPAFFLSILGGIWAWFVSLPPMVIISFFGSGGLILTSYIVCFMFLKNKREQRESNERIEQERTKQQREKFAHELTLEAMRTAADPNLNTVKVVPQSLQNSDPKK